ncbi:MAG: TRIC cation channel family protein, partial [bacterium]
MRTLSAVQTAIEVAAMASFAISGIVAAARKRLDPVGVVVVAWLAAFGGGR